jgi:hypothetical protein
MVTQVATVIEGDPKTMAAGWKHLPTASRTIILPWQQNMRESANLQGEGQRGALLHRLPEALGASARARHCKRLGEGT